MRVHPDAWVLDSGDNNLTKIKSNILKILQWPRILDDHIKSLGCIKFCDKTSICHFLKNDISLWIKFVIQCDKVGCCFWQKRVWFVHLDNFGSADVWKEMLICKLKDIISVLNHVK